MKILLAFVLCGSALALDNAVRLTETTGSAQSNRPFTLFRTFAQDEICDFPQPFVGNTGLSIWQADIWTRWPASNACPAGSVKAAHVSFFVDLPASQQIAVEFRNNANPCSSGDSNACAQAALTQAGMLGFNGGAWGAKLQVTPNPQGAATSKNVDAQSMLNAGAWTYRLRGPVVTQVVVEDRSPARSFDFGWRESWSAFSNWYVNQGQTSITVSDAGNWTSLQTPFQVVLETEVISICYATSTTLTVGTTNGSSASCANVAGRGQAGSAHVGHGPYKFLRLRGNVWLRADLGTYDTVVKVNDASSINVPTILQIADSQVRVCNKTANDLTIGTGAAGCAYNVNGQYYRGANGGATLTNNTVFDLGARSDRWLDATSNFYKSLHPVFVLTFYTGWAGVGVEYHLYNQWTDRQQDQEYDVAFFKGAGGSVQVDSRTLVRHVSNSNWKYPDGIDVGRFTSQVGDRKVWDGTVPGAVRYDYNLPYLKYAGVLPYDPSVQIDAVGIYQTLQQLTLHSAGVNPGWDIGSKCSIETGDILSTFPNNAGPYHRGFADPGGRFDIALNPFWYVSGLYSMNSSVPGSERWAEWTFGTGACSGYPDLHLWEGASTNPFCSGGESTSCPTCKSCSGANLSASAVGRPFSIDARPGAVMGANTLDPILPVGPQTANHWGIWDPLGHLPDLAFVPFLLSGDFYYEQNLGTVGGWALFAGNRYADYNPNDTRAYANQFFRHWSWGFIGATNGTRPVAWGLRSLVYAAWAMKDGTPEKEYFTKKLNVNVAIYEGKFNITNGYFYEPCTGSCADDYSYWYWGRRRQGYDSVGVTKTMVFDTIGGYDPAGFYPQNYVDQQYAFGLRSLWMDNFIYVVLGDAENKGFTQIRPLRTTVHRALLNWLRHPAMNPFSAGEYRAPGVTCLPEGVPQPGGCGSLTWDSPPKEFAFGDWNNVAKAITVPAKTRTQYVNDGDLVGGYARISYATSSFLPDGVEDGTLKGTAAWDFMVANIKSKDLEPSNQMWLFSPKVRISNVTATVGDTDATIQATSSTLDACKIAVSGAPFVSFTDDGDTDANMNGAQIVQQYGGLTPGTTYYFRIGCGPAGRTGRYQGTFTTAAAPGAATTIPLSLTVPPNRGVASVRVDYGATSGLGSNVSNACATTCTVSVPATKNKVLYYRITYLDGSNAVVGSGRVLAAVGL